MPTLLRSLLLLLGVAFLLANCAKWKVESYDLVPQVKTGSATTPATTSVQVDCIVTELGPNTLQEFGIVYSSTNQLPTINDTKAKADGTSGTAKVTLNGLLPNTTYYYRTYATNNKGLTGYGDVQSFKTATVIADVRTLDLVGAPGQTSFQAQVQVANASAITIKEYGVVYSPTSQTPTTTNDTKIVAAGTTGASVTLTISSLQPNTTYYYRAYAITDGGVVSYGEAKSVKTGEPNPVAVTLDPVGTASTTAVQVQCQVTNASAIILKEYGVVYSPTSLTPTVVADIKVPVSGTTGAAATVLLSPLVSNTTYYYRAYAIGSSGTPSYGDVKQAKTTVDILTTGVVSLTSTKPSVLENTSATVTIKVEKPAGVTEYGVVLTPDPNQVSALMAGTAAPLRKSITGAFPATGTVDFVIKDLTENSPFYAVAYAKNATGTTTFSKEVAAFQTKFGQQGNWRQLGRLPTERATVYNPLFTINGKVYVGSQAISGTANYAYFKQLYEYDPQTNLWSQKKDFPGTSRAEATVAVLNNKAYVMFGVIDNGAGQTTYTTDAWEYDQSADTWRQLSTPPANKPGGQGIYNSQAGAIPFVYNNRIYALFGRGPFNNDVNQRNVFNSLYALDPSNSSWEVSFPLNDKGLANDVIYAIARSSAFSFQSGEWVYFGGGLAVSGYTSLPFSKDFNSRQIWGYNVRTQETKKIALLPSTFNDCSSTGITGDTGGRMQNCAFVVGAKAYIVDCSHQTWVMDLNTLATPTVVTSLNNPTGTVGIGVGVGAKAYFGLRNADWWEFTP